jgi:hypothetical protein
MKQLDLFAGLTRWEIPKGRWSWREGDQTIVITIGAHSIDLAWAWYQPWHPWT